MKKKKKLIVFVVLTFLVAVYVFFAAPNLNPLYPDGAFFWLVLVSLYLLVASMTSFRIAEFGGTDGSEFHLDKSKLPKKGILLVLALLWAAYFVAHLIFTPLFFWGSYRDQMAEPEVKQFTSEVQAVDSNQIPIVDKDLASTLANRKLGEKPALGSQVVLGEPTIQNVNGKLVWAVPLLHSGFFKWLANMDGSAGYIVVSATNLQDVTYVEDYKLKYQPDSYFMDDLTRKARFTKGWFDGITDYSFELDDSGRPYWVVTTYRNVCGFNLPEADGVIIIDAQSGETIKYGFVDVPEWVDRIQPEEFILNQIDNKGKYVHGIFNFSNQDKYMASEGHNIIYNNGNCYLFTGLTSVGIDDSATGFIMVNMKTKEPILYRMSGATEMTAMQSAQGKVQDLGYRATFPIILNVYGEPTYFMTLKDSAALIKKYAFVNVRDFVAVGVGDTMADAERDYRLSMKNITNRPSFDPSGGNQSAEQTISGEITRINFTLSGGDTLYSFLLKETPGVIYTANLALNDALPLTQPGDRVTVTYQEDTADSIRSATKFENKDIFEPPAVPASQPEAPLSSAPSSQPQEALDIVSSEPAA